MYVMRSVVVRVALPAMRRCLVLTMLAGLMLQAAPPAAAQTGDDLQSLRQEVEAIRQSQAVILKEIQELRGLLQQWTSAARRGSSSPPQNVVLNLEGAPLKGDRNAKLTLVEFTDYQCPFCGRHVRETMPTILAEYVKTGKVQYVVREFPLEASHPQAFKASEAALCAGDQDQYFEMHERLFADQRALQPSDLIAHAKALGLDETGFKECLDGGKHAPRIRKDLQEGLTAGVSGTPTFFIGLTEPGQSTVKVVQRIVGGQPYQSFKNVIDGLLSQTK